MSSQVSKMYKSTKSQNQTSMTTPTSRSSSSSVSSHLAMVELKQRILTSLSKLSDRDTYQIAVEDLEKIIQGISPEGIPMLLNSLYDSTNDPKPAVKKESLRLLTVVCACHGESTSTHLTKIIANVVKRLKDSDSGVKDACREAIGALSAQYLKGEKGGVTGGAGDNGGLGSMVALFVKPLFEAMGEQNKGVQAGAALCMAKMVECATDPPVSAFQKLCPRICKLLNSPNFLAKAALLPVVASLSQVGAIAPQNLEHLLPGIHDCLGNADWATRKAAADALISLALHSSNLGPDGAVTTLTVLEACRCDKIKPVRDSMTEALQLWKIKAGKSDGASEDPKTSSCDDSPQQASMFEANNVKSPNTKEKTEALGKDLSNVSPSNLDSTSTTKGGSMSEKAVVILKKKPPVLSDKELNPDFFQKLEKRGCDELPVEVIVPRKCLNHSSESTGESDENAKYLRGSSKGKGSPMDNDPRGSFNNKFRTIERGAPSVFSERDNGDPVSCKRPEDRQSGKEVTIRPPDANDRIDINQREPSGNRMTFSKSDNFSEGSFINNKGNWLAIQRQLLQLERQQSHLMNMLQDFMGGSHDSMVTLENRVRGLERVVEDLAQDLSISSSRRDSSCATGFETSSNRSLGKYNGFSDYSNAKYGGRGDGRISFQNDGNNMSLRSRGQSWRSDIPDAWDFAGYGNSRNGPAGSRKVVGGNLVDVRSPRATHESDHGGSRRAWAKAAVPIRLGEGPSARSVWQASKDEATLEAIRVAGEDNITSRTARQAIPELTAEAMADGNDAPEKDAIWTYWNNAMDALHVGDMDSAYSEVLTSGDDFLLVKLMDRSGPVMDQLSNQIACEMVHAIGQFLLEQNLYDICLSWIQQLIEVVLENGPDVFGIPMEMKKELLMYLHEASSTDTPSDWEGAPPDQLLFQLASAWEIDLQQH